MLLCFSLIDTIATSLSLITLSFNLIVKLATANMMPALNKLH